MMQIPERIPTAVQYLAGYAVAESPYLRSDQAFVNRQTHVVVCGEAGHFVHQLRIGAIKALMRDDLQKTLDAFAARVGVDRSTISE